MAKGRQRGIRAGRAYVEVTADDTALARGLRRAEVRLKSFGAGLAKIGAIGLAAGSALAAPFAGATAVFARVGDSLDKMAARTGIATESLSALGFAAERNGSDLATVERGVRRLQNNLRNATLGLKTYTDAFDELGVSADRLAKLSPEDQFLAVAEAVSKIEDPSRRSALAQQLLGRSGAALLPLLSQGAAGIEALRREAAELGLIIDTDTSTAAAAFTDALGDLRSQAKAAAVAIGSAVAPALTRTIRALNPLVAKAIELVKLNKPLVAGIATGAAALAGLGAAAVFAGGAITLAGVAAGGLATAIGVVLSPIGLIVAALAAATIAAAKYTTVIGTAGTALRRIFGPLAARVTEVFAAIRNAMLAGDLEAALGVVTTGLRVVWLRTMNWLRDRWADASASILSAMVSFWNGAKRVFNAGSAAIQVAMGGVLAQLEKIALALTTPVGKDYFATISRGFAQIEARAAIAAGSIVIGAFSDDQGIQAAADDALALIDASRSGRKNPLAEEIKEAEEALRAALERAGAARRSAELERERFQFDLDGLGDELKRRIEAFGQFGGAGLEQAFGGDTTQAAQLGEARKTARNTARLVAGVDRLQSRLAFG